MPSADSAERQAIANKNRLSAAAANIWNVKSSGNTAGAKALYSGIGSSTVTPTAPPEPPPVDTPVSNFMADSTPIEAAAPDVTEETLKKTAEYMARERALQSALDLFNTSQSTEGTRFGESYSKNLGDLGWRGDVNDWDYGQLLSSGQKATESGRAFQSLSNDFAARGMLQSGAYQGARSILQNQLNDKRAAVEKGKVSFGEDQTAKRNAFLAEQEQARTQALADARAAILGGMGA